MKEIQKKLAKIQQELKASKNQRNTFGNYNYRSCEDILESVKPLLGDLILTISDDIIEVGGRIYVKATVLIQGEDGSETVTAMARESEDKKGMDHAQITGAASSYARKYALNGLFLIDDTKDPDATNKHGNEINPKKIANIKPEEFTDKDLPWLKDSEVDLVVVPQLEKEIDAGVTLDPKTVMQRLRQKWAISTKNADIIIQFIKSK